MAPNEVVYETLCSSGIPGAEWAFPLGKAPAPPFFVYMHERGGDLFAEDDNYAQMHRYRAELYMSEPDNAVRREFEAAISQLSPFTSNESWIPSENCLMVAYSFTYHPNR